MFVSIIIPTLNRSELLTKTLTSIINQITNSNVEIIVIDNGSTDQTALVVEKFKNQFSKLTYEYNNIPGLLTGRHRGAEIAKGEILCFLDDDVELTPTYLEGIFTTFTDNASVHLATGPSLPNYEIPSPNWLTYFWDKRPEGKFCAWLSLLDFGDERIEIHPNFVWGLNFCIRKDTLSKLGGFHPDCIPSHLQKYQGDGETGLTLKAAEKGFKAIYHPKLALKHYIPKERLTLDYFKKRAYYQGVCESFTQIRNSYFNKEENQVEIKKTIRDKLHPYYAWIKLFFQQKDKTTKEVKKILETLNQSEKSGYNFHQKQFYTDQNVKNWVLKENYFDYSLPKND